MTSWMITPKRRVKWLTPREREVLIHMIEGRSANQIATLDYVTTATVRTHIASVLTKLGVDSQLAAVAVIHRQMWPTEEARQAAIEAVLT